MCLFTQVKGQSLHMAQILPERVITPSVELELFHLYLTSPDSMPRALGTPSAVTANYWHLLMLSSSVFQQGVHLEQVKRNPSLGVEGSSGFRS